MGHPLSGDLDKWGKLRDHPHVATEFFHRKLQIWNKYFDAAIGTDEDWNRYEFQSRASIHVHGFKWLLNDPGLIELAEIAVKGHIARQSGKKTPEAVEDIRLGCAAETIIKRYADWILTS